MLYLIFITIVTILILFKLSPEPTNAERSLIGSNKCTWGPSYWCANHENAVECNFDWNECQKYVTSAPSFSQP
jgi:hypothetical protein